MELFEFPKRGELRQLLVRVWPEKGHKPLIESILRYAGSEVSADGLPAYLALAIESYCEGRSTGMRWACYASLPALIRQLTTGDTRILALGEYCAMYDRLCKPEQKHYRTAG